MMAIAVGCWLQFYAEAHSILRGTKEGSGGHRSDTFGHGGLEFVFWQRVVVHMEIVFKIVEGSGYKKGRGDVDSICGWTQGYEDCCSDVSFRHV